MIKDDVKNKLNQGQLSVIDRLPWGDENIGSSLSIYADHRYQNKQSQRWARTIGYIENILFGLGHHYINDILLSRLTSDSNDNLSISKDLVKSIPRPVNDILGRYIETNIALLTENRPVPRVTPTSDSINDVKSAELSELTINYSWEALSLAEKHREIARQIMYTGTAWLELCYDPLQPRYLSIPATETQPTTPLSTGAEVPVPREVEKIDEETGAPVLAEKVEYGDISAKVVSAFEMHFPNSHYWTGDNMNWVMREEFISIDAARDKFGASGVKNKTTKKKGYFVDRLNELQKVKLHNMPLWWWERLSEIVEGPSPSLFASTPEVWEGMTIMRIFDRKPSPLWPKGRTIITIGEQLIYDSPKDVGARSFDPKFPSRWHPYIRYAWESQIGSIWGRSLVARLLPCVKRINSVDVALIMWRRTVPIATWVSPKGASVVEDLFTGGLGGSIFEYDPNRTAGQAPTPVYPPPFPESALKERDMMLAQMEAIAGTEQVLKGERPSGVNSSTMLEALRKQALASRSAILTAWDESLQESGKAILQETIRHIKKDSRYRQRISVLAKEKASIFQIDEFSGTNLSDNVQVRIDTASEAMVSREAKQQRALELIQYGPNLAQIEPGLRAKLVSDLGWPDALVPQGADITRGRNLIHYIKTKRFELVVPLPEDDPYVIHEMLVNETKQATFMDLESDVQKVFFALIDKYKLVIEDIENTRLQMQMQMGGLGAETQ